MWRRKSLSRRSPDDKRVDQGGKRLTSADQQWRRGMTSAITRTNLLHRKKIFARRDINKQSAPLVYTAQHWLRYSALPCPGFDHSVEPITTCFGNSLARLVLRVLSALVPRDCARHFLSLFDHDLLYHLRDFMPQRAHRQIRMGRTCNGIHFPVCSAMLDLSRKSDRDTDFRSPYHVQVQRNRRATVKRTCLSPDLPG